MIANPSIQGLDNHSLEGHIGDIEGGAEKSHVGVAVLQPNQRNNASHAKIVPDPGQFPSAMNSTPVSSAVRVTCYIGTNVGVLQVSPIALPASVSVFVSLLSSHLDVLGRSSWNSWTTWKRRNPHEYRILGVKPR